MPKINSGPTSRSTAGGIEGLLPAFPFEYAEYNFQRAARQGLDADLLWVSEDPPSPREVPARELIGRLHLVRARIDLDLLSPIESRIADSAAASPPAGSAAEATGRHE